MVRIRAALCAALWRVTLSLLYYPGSLVYCEHPPQPSPAQPTLEISNLHMVDIFWVECVKCHVVRVAKCTSPHSCSGSASAALQASLQQLSPH